MNDDQLKNRMSTALAIAFCVIVLVIAAALTVKFLQWLF